jgi:hypothetical protein
VRIAFFPNSCDLARNRTLRRMYTPAKKWSMFEKWFGARMSGPTAGTLSVPIARVRYGPIASGVMTMRASS